MFKKTLSLLSNTAIAITLGAVSASADIKIGVLVPDSGPGDCSDHPLVTLQCWRRII